ncbi:MAG: polysaccharide biosynthesis tyrosine autokinase [Bacteroidetes bacterium]|nr:polysaccharide biosynthesis tyrosine autokinase [Bacteroidota bacterium]
MTMPTTNSGSTLPAAPPHLQDPSVVQDPIYYNSLSRGAALGIREFYDILLRGKWIILFAVMAIAVPVTIYTMIQPRLYRSYSLLLIHKQDESLASVLPTSPGAAFWRSERNLGNELLVLRQSEALADTVARVLAQLDAIPGTEQRALTINRAVNGDRLGYKAIGLLLQEDYVSANLEGADIDAIRVTAVSTIPVEAAFIANMYARAFVHLTRESSRASMGASRVFLQGQVEVQNDRLEELDGSVREFMAREGAIDLDDASRRLVNQVSQLQSQRDIALVDVRMKQATIAQLEIELSAIEPRLAEFVASGAGREIELAQERVAELRGRLETIYLRNPELRDADTAPEDVQALRTEVAQLNSRISDLTQQYLEEAIPVGVEGNSAAMNRITSLRRQLAEERILLSGLEAQSSVLGVRIGQYEGQLRALPRQSIRLAQLQRDRQSAVRLHAALEERLNEAQIAEQSELGYAEIVRSAAPAVIPFLPNRRRNVLLGLMLGLGLGIALAVAKTRLDNRIHLPDDLRDLGFTAIGTIPNMDKLVAQDFGGAETIVSDLRTIDTKLVVLLSPMAAASESYRALRTSIQFCRPDVVIETVLVTSAGPAEGKTVTASNLAVVMAQGWRRVLLVDADFRRPRIHKMFGMSREPGLVELLFQEESFDPEGYATSIDDLYVIPAGAHAPNPSELLGSKAMRRLIAGFRGSFDVIIFDAPPVLAATDAVLLSTQCDATIVVAKAGETKDYDLQHAYEDLESVGATVIGTLLNSFDVSKAYGYKYKYQYRYGNTYSYGHEAHKVET